MTTGLLAAPWWRGPAAALALTLALLIVAAKLHVVAPREILPFFMPHDDLWQVSAANAWFWRRPYDNLAIAHLPVYPFFIKGWSLLGIPLRVGIEITLVAAAASACLALGRLGVGRWIALVCFGLLVLHPHSLALHDRALAGTLQGCLVLFVAGQLIRVLAPRDDRDLGLHAAGLAVAFALAWYCRKESVILLGMMGVAALGLAGGAWRGWRTRAQALRIAAGLLLAPALAVVAMGTLIAGLNRVNYGAFMVTDFDGPQYRRAYRALQSIAPEPALNYAPVPRATMQRAYAVSPAARELAPYLDGAPGRNWARITHENMQGRMTDSSGEIGAGWFYWAMRDAVAAAGHYTSPRAAEAYYARLADEIEEALRSGALPSRRVFSSFVDPAISLWLPRLPDALLRSAGHALPLWPVLPHPAPSDPAGFTAAFYDAVARRRATGTFGASLAASGWVTSRAPLVAIEVVQDGKRLPVSTWRALPRPDLAGVQAAGENLSGTGYQVEARLLTDVPGWGALEFRFADGSTARTADLQRTPVLRVLPLPAEASGPGFFAIESARVTGAPPAIKSAAFVVAATSVHGLITAAFAVTCAMVAAAGWSRRAWSFEGMVALAALLALAAGQIAVFGLLDASAWPIDARYVFPAGLLIPVLLALLAQGMAPAPAADPRG